MAAVGSGVAPIDSAFDEIMSFCLQCRACEAACPSLVPFGRAMEGARAELASSLPSRSRLRRRLVGKWVRRRRLLRLGSRLAAMAQRLGYWTAPRRLRPGLRGLRRLTFSRRSVLGYGSDSSGGEIVGLLAGCVQDVWFENVHRATIGVLEEAGYRVVVPRSQTCCGALAAHDGAVPEALQMAAANQAAFGDADVVAANAAGCSAHLSGYGHMGAPSIAERATDAIQLVAAAIEDGRLPHADSTTDTAAIHDPCHHIHALRIREEPRRILRAAGYEPIDLDESGMCCGAAGTYSLQYPETSQVLGAAKADQVRAAGVAVVASANPGCEIQLRTHTNGTVRIAHPIELYAERFGMTKP